MSPLLYVIAMIPMTTIFMQTGLGYQTSMSAAKLSHLLYMDDLRLYGKSSNELESLLNTVRIFSTDISMEFGLEKCANTIKRLSLKESYKYLGVQAKDVKHRQVKKQTSAEYTNRIRKILKSKLNGGNTIQAINNWAVQVIRYTAGIVDWTKAEL